MSKQTLMVLLIVLIFAIAVLGVVWYLSYLYQAIDGISFAMNFQEVGLWMG